MIEIKIKTEEDGLLRVGVVDEKPTQQEVAQVVLALERIKHEFISKTSPDFEEKNY